MVAAVRVHKVGGPEVLTYEEIDVPAPGAGQIRVKQHACGVNFVDVYFRMGLYPAPGGLPFVAGNEAAGEVVEVGPGVGEFKRGDRVAYVSGPGCYAAERIVATDRAVKLPANINYEQAAAMMLKGKTVEYLVRRTFKVERGMNVLMHAAAGGVGLILCQWANHLGATVIGTVGSKEKAALAQANGCHHTILYRDEDFVARAALRVRSRPSTSTSCSSRVRCSPRARRSTPTPPSARICLPSPTTCSPWSAAAP